MSGGGGEPGSGDGASPDRDPVDSLRHAASPLGSLPPETLRSLRPHLELLHLAPDETLFRQGDPADRLAVVVAGQLEVVLFHDGGEQSLARLRPGDVVGEVALIGGGRRSATVRSVGPAQVVALGEPGIAALSAHPEVVASITAQAVRRARRTALTARLIDMLGAVDSAVLEEIEGLLEWVRVPAGEVLMRQGDVADAAYLVVAGRLRVLVEKDDERRVVAEVGRGELIGEMGLIDQAPRNATVVATRDCDLVRFPRRVFDRLVGRHPKLMLEVARSILRRSRSPAHRPEPELSIALVPAGPDVDLGPLTDDLVQALTGHGPTARLGSARVDAAMGKRGAAQAEAGELADLRLTHWLEAIEQRHRFVVYEADREASPWSDRVIRQADRVLLVADGTRPRSGEDAGTWVTSLAARATGYGMVLLQDPTLKHPRDTHVALSGGPVEEHYHLRRGSIPDVERLARILAGRAVGVVLSGGGARSFAHLGVVRALIEQGVPIDLVGGSSMGAVIATGAAMGYPPAEALAIAKRQFSSLLDYTLPVVSLLRGRKIERSLRETYGQRGIEDFWRTFYCVSTNLTRSECVVHRRGSIVTALRASFALPGLLPPVPVEGELLIDGGVLDNLPLGVMRQLNWRGTVIGVDVAPPRGPAARLDYGLSVSGWRALRRRRAYPRMVSTLLRAPLVGSMRDRDRMLEEGLADLYLDLDLRGVGLLDLDGVERVSARGYEAAAPKIEAWLEGQERPPWAATSSGAPRRPSR